MRSPILFIVLCPCLIAQQAGIEGTVIDAVTRQPMAGVHITMRPALGGGAGSDNAYGAISGRDGHYSIANMPPTVYALSAQRNGYVRLPRTAPNGRQDDTVTLKSGEPPTGFTVEMTPEAVIYGTVVDEFGDPVQHVEVEALPATGAARASVGARTDDRGQFRIPMASGKFYVRAEANRGPTMMQREIRSDGLDTPVYGPTYYPGTESKDQAIAVQLTPGREVTGIDIHLTRKHTLTLSGGVTGMPDHSSPANISMSSSGDSPFPRVFMTAPDGRFTVSGLPPGIYHLLAGQESATGKMQSPMVEVRLDSADQSNVSLALVRGEALTGDLSIEGDPPGTAVPDGLTVRLEPHSPEGAAKDAEVARDGSFRMDQVFPGKFRVRVLAMPENAYIKSVKLDNTEAQDGVLDLPRGVEGARLRVTINRNGGQIEGAVLGGAFAFVVLAASVDDIGGENLKLIQPGAKYSYSGLRPGKYRLIVIDGRQFSPEAPKTLFPTAPDIEVRESDRIVKDINVTEPRP